MNRKNPAGLLFGTGCAAIFILSVVIGSVDYVPSLLTGGGTELVFVPLDANATADTLDSVCEQGAVTDIAIKIGDIRPARGLLDVRAAALGNVTAGVLSEPYVCGPDYWFSDQLNESFSFHVYAHNATTGLYSPTYGELNYTATWDDCTGADKYYLNVTWLKIAGADSYIVSVWTPEHGPYHYDAYYSLTSAEAKCGATYCSVGFGNGDEDTLYSGIPVVEPNPSNSADFYINATGGLCLFGSCIGSWPAGGGGGISGSGTAGQVSYFDGASSIAGSPFFTFSNEGTPPSHASVAYVGNATDTATAVMATDVDLGESGILQVAGIWSVNATDDLAKLSYSSSDGYTTLAGYGGIRTPANIDAATAGKNITAAYFGNATLMSAKTGQFEYLNVSRSIRVPYAAAHVPYVNTTGYLETSYLFTYDGDLSVPKLTICDDMGIGGTIESDTDGLAFYSGPASINMYGNSDEIVTAASQWSHWGDFYVDGKITSTGGFDPPYVLYDAETRESVRARVLDEVPPEKLGGAAIYFNQETHQMECYIGTEDRYYLGDCSTPAGIVLLYADGAG